MAFTNESKSSSSFSNQARSGTSSISVGMPIGLLLSLTYASVPTSSITWTPDTKASSSWANQSKN